MAPTLSSAQIWRRTKMRNRSCCFASPAVMPITTRCLLKLCRNASGGLVELADLLADAGVLGDAGRRASLQVEPPREGSLELPVLTGLTDPQTVALFSFFFGTSVAGVLRNSFSILMRLARGNYASAEPPANGWVVVHFDGSPDEVVPEGLWEQFRSRPRRSHSALRRMLSALESDANELEVRSGDPGQSLDEVRASSSAVVATRADFEAALDYEPDAEADAPERSFKASASVEGARFEAGGSWWIKVDGYPVRKAKMLDAEFQELVDRGSVSVGRGTRLDITIYEQLVQQEGRIARKWKITSVNDYPGREHHDGSPSTEGRGPTS